MLPEPGELFLRKVVEVMVGKISRVIQMFTLEQVRVFYFHEAPQVLPIKPSVRPTVLQIPPQLIKDTPGLLHVETARYGQAYNPIDNQSTTKLFTGHTVRGINFTS